MALIYDTFTLGTPANLVTFNDYSHTANTIFRVRSRFPNRRSLTDFDIKLPEVDGIADFQTLMGKEFYTLEGVMYPPDETQFHVGRRALRKLAAVSIEQADPYSDNGYVPLKWIEEGGALRQLFMKVLYVDMKETTRQGIVQEFTLFCKIKYPVIFDQNTKSVTLGASTQAAPLIGGAYIPATIPMKIGASSTVSGTALPFVLPAVLGTSTATSSATATASGDYPTYPTIVIYGPVNKPRVTNVSTGEYIEFDISLGTSDSIIITYDQDSLSVTGPQGANVYGKRTDGSTFWRIKPGITNFNFTGAQLGTGSSAQINFNDAWPLS